MVITTKILEFPDMHDAQLHTDPEPGLPGWRRAPVLLLCGTVAIAGVLLLAGHGGHLLGALPYLLILACSLMHLFHGHGHGRAGGDRRP